MRSIIDLRKKIGICKNLYRQVRLPKNCDCATLKTMFFLGMSYDPFKHGSCIPIYAGSKSSIKAQKQQQQQQQKKNAGGGGDLDKNKLFALLNFH